MKFTSLFLLFLVPMLTSSQSLVFEQVHTGYSSPVDISDPEDGTDRLFITERGGIIKIIEDGSKLSTPFLNIDPRVQSGGERGLLGLVFHPNYENNGYFYVNYIDNSRYTVIARFSVSTENPSIADPNSEKIMLRFYQPFSNHNAGDLNFSPVDGYLYIAMGDGGSGGDPGCRSQDMSTFLGKILRVDVNQNENTTPYYGIPAGNMQDEIWALGLRNPWRFSFDRETGDLWIADVGQGLWEEIDFLAAGTAAGTNFGWKVMEGDNCYSGGDSGCNGFTVPACESTDYTDPIYEMPHSSPNDELEAKSITGGYVYRGCKYPALTGKYICTDYATRNSFIIDRSNSTVTYAMGPPSVSTYGEDHKGELWLASLNGGIYRVVDNDETRIITLNSGNYPLSGSYKATEEIIINSPLSQNLMDIKFITNNIVLAEDVSLPENSKLTITDDFCEED